MSDLSTTNLLRHYWSIFYNPFNNCLLGCA